MDFGLSGKRAIVCASSRGLGKACAMSLAREGCDVVINGRDAGIVAATAGEIARETGAKAIPVVADVGTADGRAKILAACPAPDILINNNGGPPPRDFRAIGRDDFVAGLEGNMITPIALIQAVIDGMAERGFGRIINITSSGVIAPLPGLDLSSGARAGLTSFIAGVARQFAARNVTINCVMPGAFDTDRLKATTRAAAEKAGRTIDEQTRARIATIPAARLGSPDELGAFCAYLASVQAGYITGQNLLIDGGAVAHVY